MIRVLSIIHHTEFSGPTNRNMRIASLLGDSGVDLTVLVPDRPLGSAYNRLKLAGAKVVRTRFHRLRTSRKFIEQTSIFLNFFPDIQRIRKIIRRKGIDVVQLNGLMNPHGAIAAKLEGKKVVWQLIDTYSPFPLMMILMPFVVLMADAVMATGKRTAEFHPLVGLIKDRLFYFNPPVDLKNYLFNPSTKRQARAAIGLASDDVVIGTVGTINPQKGHRCFIDAARLTLQQNPDTKFVIIGSELNTQVEYAANIRKYARSQGLIIGKNLMFVDPKDRVHFFEHALDIFWMTSMPRSEGIPTSIQEAMALGIPVIGTDVGSVSEIVRHGETGYIVKPNDAQGIANHSHYLISHPEVRRFFGRAADKIAHESFSSENCADRHYACYRFCMGMEKK